MPGSSLSTPADAGPPERSTISGCGDSISQLNLRKYGAVIRGKAGLLAPPVIGLAASELDASPPVIALVIAMSLIPSIPMVICAYVWSRGALKAIRAAAQGEPEKSKEIISAMTGALRALPPGLRR
jgi:hypothetical protein